jgi:5-methylcytosine-specific restriction endonuclease McrBC GTP-binding regulatory subunit McrB
MQPGDFVVVKVGRGKILGIGEIESEYRYEPNRKDFQHTRSVRWFKAARLQLPESALVPTKTLTDVTDYEEFVTFVEEHVIAEAAPPIPVAASLTEPYTLERALEGLFMSAEDFSRILEALRRKKNVILQGAPGVGKTFVSRRLAYALMGAKDRTRVEFVQFHQSYGYEDFIQGWRPDGQGGFRLRSGVFHDFTRSAIERGEPHVLIIDEINRGNLGRILGELMMLIEAEYRGPENAIPLTYSVDRLDRFYVPENLYLLVLMNTADRSLAMVDYALRRRFSFFTLAPGFESDAFRKTLRLASVPEEFVTRIVSRLTALNEVIREEKDLGLSFRIGHSYFCPSDSRIVDPEVWYSDIVKCEIAPLLREYWFDNPQRAEQHIDDLLE